MKWRFGVRKYIIFALIFVMAMTAACGGGGDSTTQAKGEAKHVATFLDDIFQKGDLNGAYEMLSGADRAMLGMMPGFYDFITGKETDAMPEELQIAQVAFKEFTPVPSNLIHYEIGDPEGTGDTVMVPVTFYVPKQNMEDFFKDKIDPDLYDQLENMDQSDMTLDQKKELIVKAAKEAKAAIKGKTFEMDSNTNKVTLIKEDGKWKLSIIASGFMNAMGGM